MDINKRAKERRAKRMIYDWLSDRLRQDAGSGLLEKKRKKLLIKEQGGRWVTQGKIALYDRLRHRT
jgi:hypothetical protein